MHVAATRSSRRAHVLPHAIERRARRRDPVPATNSAEIAVAASASRSAVLVGEELRDRALEPPPFALEHAAARPAPAALRDRLQLVDLLARQRRAARARGCRGRARPRRSPVFVTPNSAPRTRAVTSLDLEPVAQVGPVDAVALHRVRVRHAPERRRECRDPPRAKRAHEPLGDAHDVLLRDERRLDVDLRELRLPVGAQVLVAEAARDLEVAVEARDHQQLLVELRRLRQRVELARMHAARHQIVARAFRRRLRENRRLDLEETRVAEVRAASPASDEWRRTMLSLQLGAPQVEIAMAQPQLLRRRAARRVPRATGIDGRLRRADHRSDVPPNLDVARRQLGVAHRRRDAPRRPFDQHDGLGAERSAATSQRLGRRGGRIERHLHEPGAVAQVDEDEPAEIARAMHPAAQSHARADVLESKRTAERVAKSAS